MTMNLSASRPRPSSGRLATRRARFPQLRNFWNSNPNETSCLILDVQMKGLSGVELLERLIAEGRQTPVIFVTAFPDERVRDHVLDAGAVGFLRKPFSDEKLTRCLDTALANYPS